MWFRCLFLLHVFVCSLCGQDRESEELPKHTTVNFLPDVSAQVPTPIGLPTPLSLTNEEAMNGSVEDIVRQYFGKGNYTEGSKNLWKVVCENKALLEQNAFAASRAFVYLVAMSGCKIDAPQRPGDVFCIKGPNYSSEPTVQDGASTPYELNVPNGLYKWLEYHARQQGEGEFTKAAKFAAYYVRLRDYVSSELFGKNKTDAKQKIWDLADAGFPPAQYYLGKQFEKIRYINPEYYGWFFQCSRKAACSLYWYERANGKTEGVVCHEDAAEKATALRISLKAAYMNNANHIVHWLTVATGAATAGFSSSKCPHVLSSDQCQSATTWLASFTAAIPAAWSVANMVTSSMADTIIGCISLKKPDSKMFVH